MAARNRIPVAVPEPTRFDRIAFAACQWVWLAMIAAVFISAESPTFSLILGIVLFLTFCGVLIHRYPLVGWFALGMMRGGRRRW